MVSACPPADAALVFLERHVELPVQIVFDTPVAAHRLGESSRRDVLAKNVVADFDALLAVAPGDVDGDSNRSEVSPARSIRQVFGTEQR